MSQYDFESQLSDVPASEIFSFENMKYTRSKPPSSTRRLSDRWRESLKYHLNDFMKNNEPIEIFSTSIGTGYPMVDTVLVTELTAAKITVKKLLGKHIASGNTPKEISYPYDNVYGISKPKKEARTLAVINMQRALGVEPKITEHVPGVSEAKNLAAREKKGTDFELFLGLEYERFGHIVSYNGIEKGKDDEGVDIVAYDFVDGQTYLVQAKNRVFDLNIEDSIRMIRNFVAYEEKNSPKIPIRIFAHTGDISNETYEWLADYDVICRQFVLPASINGVKCFESDGKRFYVTTKDPDFYQLQISLFDVGFLVESIEEAEQLGFQRLRSL